MGISTDGQLCFGIKFEEGFVFPWDNDEYEGDIECWWLYGVHGYKNPFELFDERGEWIGGIKPPEEKIDEYYDTRWEFEKLLPSIPVTLVNYCSDSYPMYILTIGESCTTASRGYPEEVKQAVNNCPAWALELYQFCKVHDIETSDIAKWWLSSYYG